MSPRARATLLVSVLFYGALIASVLGEPGFWQRAFGPSVLGLPSPVAVALLVTGLFLPLPWFVWHAMAVVLRGRDLGFSPGKLGILLMFLTIGPRAPELRHSQRDALGGLGYALALLAAWVLYASAQGL